VREAKLAAHPKPPRRRRASRLGPTGSSRVTGRIGAVRVVRALPVGARTRRSRPRDRPRGACASPPSPAATCAATRPSWPGPGAARAGVARTELARSRHAPDACAEAVASQLVTSSRRTPQPLTTVAVRRIRAGGVMARASDARGLCGARAPGVGVPGSSALRATRASCFGWIVRQTRLKTHHCSAQLIPASRAVAISWVARATPPARGARLIGARVRQMGLPDRMTRHGRIVLRPAARTAGLPGTVQHEESDGMPSGGSQSTAAPRSRAGGTGTPPEVLQDLLTPSCAASVEELEQLLYAVSSATA